MSLIPDYFRRIHVEIVPGGYDGVSAITSRMESPGVKDSYSATFLSRCSTAPRSWASLPEVMSLAVL